LREFFSPMNGDWNQELTVMLVRATNTTTKARGVFRTVKFDEKTLGIRPQDKVLTPRMDSRA
jgi:hypothetical protein